MKRVCCGALLWTTDAFWRASLVDIHDAMDGWGEVHGAREPGSNAPSREEIEDLARRYPGTSSIRTNNPSGN